MEHPTILLTEEVATEHASGWTSIASVLEISFGISDKWRIIASVQHQHEISDPNKLLSDIKAFMHTINITKPLQFIKDISTGATFDAVLHVEFLYMVKPKAGITPLQDIVAVMFTTPTQPDKDSGKVLWGYMQPIINKWPKDKQAKMSNHVKTGTLSMSHLLQAPLGFGVSKLAEIYVDLAKQEYTYQHKHDGERVILIIDHQKTITYHRLGKGFVLEDTMESIKGIPTGVTILDVEHLENADIAFDVLLYNNKDVTGYNRKDRNKILKNAVNDKLVKSLSRIGVHISINTPYPLTRSTFSKDLLHMFERKAEGYVYDGLIVYAMNASYYTEEIYKFKPASLLTVDFLAKQLQGDEYLLYTGMNVKYAKQSMHEMIRDNPHFDTHFPDFQKVGMMPVPFVVATIPNTHIIVSKDNIDNSIIECLWEGKWVLHRLREDKTADAQAGKPIFGNAYITAIHVLYDISKPITPEMVKDVDIILSHLPVQHDKDMMKYIYKSIKPFVKHETLIEVGLFDTNLVSDASGIDIHHSVVMDHDLDRILAREISAFEKDKKHDFDMRVLPLDTKEVFDEPVLTTWGNASKEDTDILVRVSAKAPAVVIVYLDSDAIFEMIKTPFERKKVYKVDKAGTITIFDTRNTTIKPLYKIKEPTLKSFNFTVTMGSKTLYLNSRKDLIKAFKGFDIALDEKISSAAVSSAEGMLLSLYRILILKSAKKV